MPLPATFTAASLPFFRGACRWKSEGEKRYKRFSCIMELANPVHCSDLRVLRALLGAHSLRLPYLKNVHYI